ncbi:MAG TPA: T9SS type A sorting domain-containing protein [Bacteroidaceae bacterium]|nr:T9SS type A sorting domain-containing protein [Bacteroidaceae bacterium]
MAEVLVATPTIGELMTSYSGFATDSVTVNADGSYTVKLGFGRNIVKLIAADGAASYQIITAKPVTYTISNLTNPGEAFVPGDEVSVLFNRLYHPANKMSGIYNMSAGIQYSNADINFPLILGPGQYTFASRAQEFKATIPADFTENEFVLEKGVLKTKGFGSSYGAHRKITKQNGVSPNLNASVREAYFGAIPDIHIPVANYTVTATSGTSDDWGVYQFGEISPAGDSVVAKGGSIQYNFTPDPGYHIGSVTLGAYTDVTAQVVDNTFTIENVSSDTSITVLYAVDKNNSITADDIVYWVGEGDNKVILAVNWADLSLAWGYRFATATLTVEEALDAVQTADRRFAYEAAYGYLNDIRFTDADQALAIAPDFVMYNVNEEPIFLSYQEQLLSHGDILEFGVYSTVLTDNFWNNVWTAKISPVSSPTSGVNNLNTSKISIYPNPFTDYIVVSAQKNGTATIYNLSGKAMLNTDIKNGSNYIDTSLLTKGVYILKIDGNSIKIIK